VKKWEARENTRGLTDFFAIVDLQTDYLHDILLLLRTYNGTQCLSKLDFDKASRATKKFLEPKLVDVSFESIVDVDTKKNKVIQVCKPRSENKDDSMNNLLRDYQK